MTTERLTATGLTIRTATPDDVDVLLPMVNAAYRQSEGHVFPTTERIERTGALKQIDGIAVAEVADKLAGCVHVEIGIDSAHFGMLAVDVSMQGRGVASALIEDAERTARDAGCAVMTIEVIREGGNVPFYERRGYRIIGETPGHVWNQGADWGAVAAWHMVDMEKEL